MAGCVMTRERFHLLIPLRQPMRRQVEVVISNQGKDRNFEENLESDVMEIITVFWTRL